MNNNTFRITCGDTALRSVSMSIALEASPGTHQRPGDASRMASYPDCGGSLSLPCEVATFVANLPSQQRAALMLRRFHQRSYADIATVLGCTEHEARATVHEALRALRAHLGDRL